MDKETNADKPLGAASLEGAQFEVTYYDVQGYGNQDAVSKDVATEIASKSNLTRSWTFATYEDGSINYQTDTPLAGSDEVYTYANYNTIPLGTVVIHEVQAPKGYLNNNEDIYWVREITSDGNKESVSTYNAPANGNITDQVKRGDFEFSKNR